MKLSHTTFPCAALLAALLGMPPAAAQNNLGDAPQVSPAAPATSPPQAGGVPPEPTARSAPPSASQASAETQDFGVAPSTTLRASEQLHGPTPTSIPGGKVVDTRQLAEWMQGQKDPNGRVLLLHAIGGLEHLPQAIPATPASQGGSFTDDVQRDFGKFLEQVTRGDRERLIVTYCAGVHCWGSYNAALRAIHLGYRNVHWYRGGIEAWRNAGLLVRVGADPQ